MMRSRIDGGPLRLGILGGGQLGRMLALAAAPLGVRCIVLDPGGAASPAGQVCPGSLAGSFTDPAAIRELASLVDVLTVEIEHVDADALAAAGAAAGVPVHPAPATIRLIQDKLLQKEAMRARGVPVGWFERADTEAELRAQVEVRGAGRGAQAGRVTAHPFTGLGQLGVVCAPLSLSLHLCAPFLYTHPALANAHFFHSLATPHARTRHLNACRKWGFPPW